MVYWGSIILSPHSCIVGSVSFYKRRKVDEVTSEVALHPQVWEGRLAGVRGGSELPGAGRPFYQLLEVGGCLVQL